MVSKNLYITSHESNSVRRVGISASTRKRKKIKQKLTGGVAANLKEFLEIVELTMNITTNCYRAFHLLYIALFYQDLFSLGTILVG